MTAADTTMTRPEFILGLGRLHLGRPQAFAVPSRLPPRTMLAASVALACSNWRHAERVPEGWWLTELARR